MTFTAIHTPGHTQGSTCFLLEVDGEAPVLFSGDHLFAGSIGRTDLPGGNHEQLMASMAAKILPLDDAIQVLPGHGETTTIGKERATNPFLQGAAQAARAASPFERYHSTLSATAAAKSVRVKRNPVDSMASVDSRLLRLVLVMSRRRSGVNRMAGSIPWSTMCWCTPPAPVLVEALAADLDLHPEALGQHVGHVMARGVDAVDHVERPARPPPSDRARWMVAAIRSSTCTSRCSMGSAATARRGRPAARSMAVSRMALASSLVAPGPVDGDRPEHDDRHAVPAAGPHLLLGAPLGLAVAPAGVGLDVLPDREGELLLLAVDRRRAHVHEPLQRPPAGGVEEPGGGVDVVALHLLLGRLGAGRAGQVEDVGDPGAQRPEGAEVVAGQVGGLVLDLRGQVVGPGPAAGGPHPEAFGQEGGHQPGGDEAGGAGHEGERFTHRQS